MRILYRIDTSEYATHKIVNISVLNFIANFKSLKKIQTYFNAWDSIFLSETQAKFFSDFRSRFLFPGVDYREWNRIGRIQDANVRCPQPEVRTATWDTTSDRVTVSLRYITSHSGTNRWIEKNRLKNSRHFLSYFLSSFDIRYHRM